MGFSKYLKRAVIIIGSLVVFMAATLVVILAIGITINVDEIRAKVAAAASKAIGRKVGIEGHLAFGLSFRPALELEGLQIANPSSWDTTDFVKVSLFRAQIRILPLLRKRIHIEEISAEGIDVQLELKADGQKNWLFDLPRETGAESPPSDGSGEPFKVNLVEVDEFSLGQLTISFLDHESDQSYDFELNSMRGSAVADEPFEIAIDGAFQKQRYYISVSGDPIGELFKPTQSWHLEASAEMAGITLNISGQADRPLEGKGFDFQFKLNGDRFGNLAELMGYQLPPLGAFQMASHLKETSTGYSLSKLKGYFGKTAFDGKLDVNLSGDIPAIRAELLIPTVDAGPLREISGQAPDPDKNQNIEASDDTRPSFEAVAISLDILNGFNADVELKVDQIINAPGDIRNASLKVAVHDGELAAPMTVTLADVSFQGNLDLKNYNDMPGFQISLSSDDTDLGNLVQVFTNTEGVEGHLKAFEFSLGGAGHNLQSLLENIDLQMAFRDAALSYGNVADGRPVSFNLRGAKVVLLHDQKMSIEASGALLDVPVKLQVSGGNFKQILTGKPWPIDISAAGGGAKLSIKGSIAGLDDPAGSNLTMNVSGKRIGDLAALLGVSPKSKLSYHMSGKLKLTDQKWEMHSLSAHLGKTKLNGQLGWKPSDTSPLLTAKLRLKNVDLTELQSIAAIDQSSKKESGKEGFTFEMPIMPQAVEFRDADIDIGINRIQLRKFDLKNFSLTSRIRDGWVKNSPFQLSVEDVKFKGALSLDLRSKVPAFKFKVDSTKVDIGALLDELNIVEGMEAAAGSFALEMHIKGSKLRTILDRSSFSAKMKNGNWTLRDPNTGAGLQIRVIECVVGASAGKPVIWSINGRIKDEPVKIQIKGDRLSVLADKKVPMPLDILAEAAGVKLQLSGQVELPLKQQKWDFKMLLSGERLNSINNFLEIDLPPYGPYELGGRIQLKKDGYYLSDFNVRVNQSHMTGKMSFKTVARPPRLDIDLTTRTLQMDDFKVGDWSPVKQTTAADKQKTAAKKTMQQDADRPAVQSLLSPAFIRRLDARFNLKVQEILSGKDKLGSGNLAAGLEKGRFFVDPMQLNFPGGSVKLAFAFEPTDTDAALEASAKIEQFDFGILARRIKPESTMGGWLSLDINLKSRAKSLHTIMHHANGHIDFAIVPQDFEADLFELWAINLLTAVLPKLDSEATSKVNCAVFRFDIKDGKMKQNAIFADTTKMQVGGEAKVNFKTEEVYMSMASKAKKAQFFSLATPIQVKGTFTDYDIDVKPGGLIGTAIRFITSPVVVPIKRVFTERAPADGKAACSAAMHRSHK
ncbi:MAG: AsmA family protein [Deltaproteobacteria bacterium]|nr:AsmA family protein [Deltaproteobacteria bacterium]